MSIITYFSAHGPSEAWDGPPRHHRPTGLLRPDPQWQVKAFSPFSHPSVSIPQRALINIQSAQKLPTGIKTHFVSIMSYTLELRGVIGESQNSRGISDSYSVTSTDNFKGRKEFSVKVQLPVI